MAHVLKLTDGTTTVNLTSGTSALTEMYKPATPGTTPQLTQLEGVRDGGEIALVTRQNVTETLEIVLVAASTTALQTVANSIEKLLMAAERKQRWGVGSKVYLTAKLDGESYTWRSEVLTGRLEYRDNVLTSGWANIRAESRLHITRRPYWEYGETNPIQLSMTSSATSPAATTVTIYNNDNATASQTNWIEIASTETIGTLPAPVKIQIQNTSGASINMYGMHIAGNHFASPDSFSHFLRGANAVGGATVSWSSYPSHNLGTNNWQFNIGATRIAAMAGKYWRVLGTFTTATSNTYARLNTAYHFSTLYNGTWAGEEVLLDTNNIIDLGVFPVPDVSSATLFDLVVTIRNTEFSSGSAVMDFIMLTPAMTHRKIYKSSWTNPADNDTVVDDGIERQTYMIDDSATPDDYVPMFTTYGDWVHLWPGVTQRLYVLYGSSGGWSSVVGNTMDVQMWYRPRRLTI